MSLPLISRSPDLKRLRDDGYDVEVRYGYLLIKGVPYVDSKKEVRRGILVSTLTMSGEVIAKPSDHVALFSGDHPCDADGSAITKIVNESVVKKLGDDLTVHYSFSSKPSGGYQDYYDKMTTYVRIISGPACAIDPQATAVTFPVLETKESESVFTYIDTASSRAQIDVATEKLRLARIAIVGLGGTGSYVLDLVSKTPVREIHLFDGDWFFSHNAFRSPGAASVDDLKGQPKKVTYFKSQYSRMHRGIVTHDYYVDDTHVAELQRMDFVFLCLDMGKAKRLIVENLEQFGTPFADVGMGVELDDDSLLGGVLRVTTSTARRRALASGNGRIPFSDGDGNNDYSRNIQIADLNALNAAMAVIKWKKLFHFYRDLQNEHHITYTIDCNMLISDDAP